MPGQCDRYNMRRQVKLTANVSNADLTANFQSVRLAFVTVSTVPAVIAGATLMLWLLPQPWLIRDSLTV